MRTLAGFLFPPPAAMGTDKYDKPHLTVDQQIELLRVRGLTIGDNSAAAQFLSRVNYYRLSAYRFPFEIGEHVFKPGTRFEYLRDLYIFDQELRQLMRSALEDVEVTLRTAIAYHWGLKYGPFGHENRNNFAKGFDFSAWIENLRKETYGSKEVFVTHFRGKYAEFPALPIWAAVEIIPFGRLSRMYAGMKEEDQASIAAHFRIHHEILKSWLLSLSYLRNMCAHHARLWNRQLAVSPMIPRSRKHPEWGRDDLPVPRRLSAVLFVMNYLLNNPNGSAHFAVSWRGKIELLIKSGVSVPGYLEMMGLRNGWERHPLWSAQRTD